MPCYSPLSAWQTDGGEIVFAERGRIRRALTLPCGQCIGCRLERSRQWATRCLHEASMHNHNSFVTLTYDDDHVPHDRCLNYSHFQDFMKRLREACVWKDEFKNRWKLPIRFYMAGEYGELLQRPHFHACLFGINFSDRVYHGKSPSGESLYRSKFLEGLWTFGFSTIGDVTFESAAYCARYITKKINGDRADDHYRIFDPETGEIYWRTPEFSHMSLKPGIGASWYKKFNSEVYPLDRVVVRGKEAKPPKYYDNLLKKELNFRWDDIEYQRYLKCSANAYDNTPERLAIREKVAKAGLNVYKRSLG